MSTAHAPEPGNFYIWRAADDFAIHLSIKVVTQLTAQITRAGSQRRSGELRGVLLGRTIEEPFRATLIEDVELIGSSDEAESSQENDDTLFEIALGKAREGSALRVLGFFRCRRDGRLNMGRCDRETFSRLFCEPGNVALLIQTAKQGNESDAALFYWDRGRVQPRDFGFGIPFDAGQLVSGHPGWRYPDPIDRSNSPAPPAAAPETAPAPEWVMPPPPIPEASRDRVRWGRLAPTFLLVGLAIVALQLATSSKHPVAAAGPIEASTPETAPAESAPLPPASPAATPSATAAPAAQNIDRRLGLSVNSHPHQIEIRWNRASAGIAASDKGLMKITEDGITEALTFDQTQLRDGYVAYTPKTNDVSIRLEVTGKDGVTTSESIRAVAIP